MRIGVAALLCCLAGLPSHAATPTQAERQARRVAEKARLEQIRYIGTTRPKRDEAYLRSDNITDAEVRQLQGAARAVLPESIVNIGGVTTDCPCEDGPKCEAQVWVIASDAEKTVGLMFTRAEGQWSIGPLQQWWQKYDVLQLQRPGYGRDNFAKRVAWQEQVDAHYAAFPSCGSP